MRQTLRILFSSLREIIARRKVVIFIACHIIILTSLVLISSIKVLTGNAIEKNGIFKVLFGQQILARSILSPVESIQGQANEAIATLSTIAAGKATSFVAEATKAGNDVENVVNSAIAAGETFLSGHVPEGCSVGTKYGCIIFEARSDCMQIPMDKTSDFDDIATLFPSVEDLGNLLRRIPPLQMFLALGLVLVIFSSFISITSGLAVFNFPFRSSIRFIMSLLGCVSFLAFTVIVSMVYTSGSQLAKSAEGTLHQGGVYGASIGIAVLGLLHLGVVTAETGSEELWISIESKPIVRIFFYQRVSEKGTSVHYHNNAKEIEMNVASCTITSP
ncbi:hypothetical protein EDB80DRAFT_693479 [Ilyonectria destructans]|nr:hypothetical protein EDB80DRAFT_693479 [Ilyonectria destructans]